MYLFACNIGIWRREWLCTKPLIKYNKMLYSIDFSFSVLCFYFLTSKWLVLSSVSIVHSTLKRECSEPCFSPFATIQDVAENGCSTAPEQSLPRTAPSPLVEKKDPKLREDRRPITVHFGQVCVGVRFL